MPVHAVLGHLTLVLAPVTAVLAVLYAWLPRSRGALRIPLVALSAVTVVFAYWAGALGTTLLHTLEDSSEAAGEDLPAAVDRHTAQANTLSLAAVVLLVAVLVVVWWILSPRRTAGTGALVGAILLTVCAVGVGWFSVTTLIEGLNAVWAQHPGWPG